MLCSEFRAALHDYFLDLLPAARGEAIEAHARECADCGALMQLALELSCRDFVQFLNEYLEGTLSAERRAVFERHLSICSDCTAYLDSYRKTMQLTALAMAPDAFPVPPEDLIVAILAARRVP